MKQNKNNKLLLRFVAVDVVVIVVAKLLPFSKGLKVDSYSALGSSQQIKRVSAQKIIEQQITECKMIDCKISPYKFTTINGT